LSPLQVDFELVLRRPIETAAFIRDFAAFTMQCSPGAPPMTITF
jgi:hypothetical protein